MQQPQKFKFIGSAEKFCQFDHPIFLKSHKVSRGVLVLHGSVLTSVERDYAVHSTAILHGIDKFISLAGISAQRPRYSILLFLVPILPLPLPRYYPPRSRWRSAAKM